MMKTITRLISLLLVAVSAMLFGLYVGAGQTPNILDIWFIFFCYAFGGAGVLFN